jgi:hypothetical protein
MLLDRLDGSSVPESPVGGRPESSLELAFEKSADVCPGVVFPGRADGENGGNVSRQCTVECTLVRIQSRLKVIGSVRDCRGSNLEDSQQQQVSYTSTSTSSDSNSPSLAVHSRRPRPCLYHPHLPLFGALGPTRGVLQRERQLAKTGLIVDTCQGPPPRHPHARIRTATGRVLVHKPAPSCQSRFSITWTVRRLTISSPSSLPAADPASPSRNTESGSN